MPISQLIDDTLIAAVDLGSNSFHLAVARIDHGELRVLTGLSEKVQLGAGLDSENRLTEEAQERALECLARFSEHLAGVGPKRLRIVGTNALRVARNSAAFIRKAEKLLQHPIEIIAGREEARLIYLGVAHTAGAAGRRLVVDIGGGSTEFIVGEAFEPIETESLHMGCISYTKRFFGDGEISSKLMDRAITAARQEVAVIESRYRELGWEVALGSSGTIKAVSQVLQGLGLVSERGGITLIGLLKLKAEILKYKHVRDIQVPGLKEDRKAIIPAGLAVVLGVFEQLGLQEMEYADGALREGVLYDMLGRFGQRDVRDRSVQALMARYHVDVEQARRVKETAEFIFDQVSPQMQFEAEDLDLLRRAALVHEIGLGISHSGYHKHSAYLIRYSDLPGFSNPAQEAMALLVGSHRRKFKAEQQTEVVNVGGKKLLQLCLILRLAARLHHSRSKAALPLLSVKLDGKKFEMTFECAWLESHPLTKAGLEEEAQLFSSLGSALQFS